MTIAITRELAEWNSSCGSSFFLLTLSFYVLLECSIQRWPLYLAHTHEPHHHTTRRPLAVDDGQRYLSYFICGSHSEAVGAVSYLVPAGAPRTNMADEMDAQKPKTIFARPSLGAGAGHWSQSFCFPTVGGRLTDSIFYDNFKWY